MAEIDAFADSQSQSPRTGNDLFDDNDDTRSNADEDTLQLILKELQQLRKEVAALRGTRATSFSLEKCSFKNHLTATLKRNFSLYPWFETSTEFKSMVEQHLANEGHNGNMGAMRIVLSYATTRYTEYRNQLRRKIIAHIQEIKTINLNSLCKLLLGVYAPTWEETCTEERLHHVLIIRSFLHSIGYESNWSWTNLKPFFKTVIEDQRENKWEIIKERDNRRCQRMLREQ